MTKFQRNYMKWMLYQLYLSMTVATMIYLMWLILWIPYWTTWNKQSTSLWTIMNKQLKYQDSSCPDPSSSQSMEQETLRALLDLTKTELLSQTKIRELIRELEESQKAQKDAMIRVMSAEDDLQRLKRRYGQKSNDERGCEQGPYDFGAIRHDKHRYKQDYRHQYYSSQVDYSYRLGKSRPEFQPVMEKYHRKYW